MSFDLGVWYSNHPLTNKQACEIYLRLCEDGPYLEGDSPAVASFYEELTAHWPEIDTIPEDKIGDFDFCPWSCALDHGGMSVVMSCVWPQAESVGEFVERLAIKHGLLLYDPQADQVTLPEHLRAKKRSLFQRLFNGSVN
jgi:hypothetical protein